MTRLALWAGIVLAIVAVVGIGILYANRAAGPAVNVYPTVYAKTAIPFGTPVTRDEVEISMLPAEERAYDVCSDISAVVGHVVTADVPVQGEIGFRSNDQQLVLAPIDRGGPA